MSNDFDNIFDNFKSEMKDLLIKEQNKSEQKKLKSVFARIPASDYLKLGIELKRKDISLQNWIIKKIEEIQ